MTDLIDIVGLDELAATFGRGAAELAAARVDGAAELAKLARWSERSRFEGLLENQEAWAKRMAEDLALRASGMSASEATAQALSTQSLAGDRVGNRPDAGYYGRTQPSETRFAVERIEELLRTDGRSFGFFSIGDTDVSKDELLEIAEILSGLSPAVLRGVFIGLHDSTIDTWLEELEASDIETAIQRLMFAHLAPFLTASQLARLALRSAGEIRSHLLEAIAAQTPDRQRWVFRSVVDHIEQEHHPGLAVSLLSAMDAPTREAALLRLDRHGQLESFVESLVVVEDRVDVRSRAATVSVSYRYDASVFAQLMESLTTVDNADLKAAAFVAGIGVLDEPLADSSDVLRVGLGVTTTHRFVEGTDEAALAAMAALIISDPIGVFDALRLNADIYGSATSDYFRALLRESGPRPDTHGEPLSHDGAILANEILASLVGIDLDPEARAGFFQATELASGGLEDYVNASRLGYFAGSLSSGLDDLGISDDDEWTAAGIILGGVGLVDPTKVTAVVEYFETNLNEISSDIQDRTIEQLRLEYGEFERMIVDQILPRAGQYIYDGDAADEFFNTYDRVGGIVTGQ